MAKSGESWKKWRKVRISGESWGKVAKSWKVEFFFVKWPPPGNLDDQRSLSIAFLAISDQYATFYFFSKWPPAAILEVPFGPFWMTENHFRSHFSPFQINTQLLAILEVRFVPKTIGFFHYMLSMAMPNMKLIGEFVTQLEMPQAF